MATNLADDDLIEMRVVCQLGPQISVNVYHYRCTNRTVVAGEVTTADAAVHLSAAFDGLYQAAISDEALFFGVGVRRLTPTLTLEDGWAGNQGQGLAGGVALPAQTCGIITYTTGVGGRDQRGRRYMPFPSTAFMEPPAVPNGAYITALNNVANEYLGGDTITGSGGTTIDLVAVLKHAANTHTDLTTKQSRLRWAVQRRRGSYGRPNALPGWPS